jgi:lysophospholipase L1-like esterase
MNYFWVILTASLVGLVLLEISLRLLFGFGTPLLYTADAKIGYLIRPNQQIRRFGKQITINQFSMRNRSIAPTRPARTLRVLMLGDSIINGGWWTDQSDTIPALLQSQLQRQLTEQMQSDYAQIEVLNASANSWSPRNELAYLQRFGSFEAQVVVLVINTDDLFGTVPTSAVVGRDRNYPDRNPPLALIEVLNRYLVQPRPIPELAAIQSVGENRVEANLAAIKQIQTMAQQNHAKFILLLTPLLREVETEPRGYEQKARQRLQQFAEAEAIPFVDYLPIFKALPDPKAIYHDSIHLSLSGNQQVMQYLIEQVDQALDAPQS